MEARIIVRNVWRRYRLTNDIIPRDHALKYGVTPKKRAWVPTKITL